MTLQHTRMRLACVLFACSVAQQPVSTQLITLHMHMQEEVAARLWCPNTGR
jgi:hypothetical protein